MQTFSVEGLVGGTFGSFRLTRLLGHGTLSAVYEAVQIKDNSSVMLTMFVAPETLASDARELFRRRFLQEGKALTRLSHPALLPILECGELDGSPYLVTPFASKVPVSTLLKQRGHFTPEETLLLLKQVAAAVDYAHEQRVIHGTLSPKNILVDQDLSVMVAGFGLMRLIEQRGIVPLTQPYAHLLSIGGTFLGAPEYLAPELVQGQTIDGRVDMYALGVILYELLSGSCPFGGTNPYEVALQHGRQRVPALHEVRPSVPAALDVVVGQALETDPARRFSTGAALAAAFERVLKILESAQPTAHTSMQKAVRHALLTLPPTVDWFSQEGIPAPAGAPVADPDLYSGATQQMQAEDNVPPVDPLSWWSSSQAHASAGQMLPSNGSQTASRRPAQQTHKRAGRRRALTLLATGGVVTVGLLGFGGVGLAQFLQKKPGQTQGGNGSQANVQPTGASTQKPGTNPTQATTTKTKPSPAATKAAQPTAKPTQPPLQQQPTAAPTQAPQPTQAPAPTATTAPAPTATTAPPTHTGTVVGMTTQATNSSTNFTNPADGNRSLLIHLPNGNFVAFESVCTHEGASCSYDGTNIVCSRHGAMFDPNQNAKVVQGPANTPLKAVPIRVNADGTVTTG